jgi:hypothetical protein
MALLTAIGQVAQVIFSTSKVAVWSLSDAAAKLAARKNDAINVQASFMILSSIKKRCP